MTAEKHGECRHDYRDDYRHNPCISNIFFKSFFILGTKALGYWKRKAGTHTLAEADDEKADASGRADCG